MIKRAASLALFLVAISLVPTDVYAQATKLGKGLQLNTSTTLQVAPTGTARIRYNGSSLQSSISGAAYTNLGTFFIAQNSVTCIASTNVTSTSFVDIGDGSTTGFANYVVTIPQTSTYLVVVDIEYLYNPMGGGGGITDYRLVVDGTPVTSPSGASPTFNQSGTVFHISWRVPVAFTSGSRTLKVQAKTYSGNTVTFGTGYFRNITIIGPG